FGVRDVLAILLVGGLGCQRERGQAAIVVGANFWVAADKADEGYFVLVHNRVSCLLNFPLLLGSHWAKPGEWARLPRPKVCFLGGARKKFARRFVPPIANLFWEEPRSRRGAEIGDPGKPGVGLLG